MIQSEKVAKEKACSNCVESIRQIGKIRNEIRKRSQIRYDCPLWNVLSWHFKTRTDVAFVTMDEDVFQN
jgi:hypothetical protein